MINFSKISNRSFLGIFLRNLLKFIPENTTVRILQGRLMGKKWIKGSGQNGYWLGTYELKKQQIFQSEIKKGDIIYDIGSHAGFYSLLSAELTGTTGKVFSFEPLPENFQYLKKHIEKNRFNNIFPFQVAVLDKSGPISLKKGKDTSESSIVSRGDITVQTISIDELIASGRLPQPDVIKIDVEGSEFLVLSGMRELLRNKKPIIFLSIHGPRVHNRCYHFLLSLGYELIVVGSDNDELLAKA